jgi:hypothetical protein
MIFPAGSTFVFDSWTCTADKDSKLQNRLMEIPTPQDITADQLAEKLS